MIEIGCRGCEDFLTTLTGGTLCKGGNPFFAVGAGKMHEHVRLRFGGCGTSWMCTGKGYTHIGIRLLSSVGGMRLRHMLEIRGFLDELLIRAMCTGEFIILHMLCLYMIIHGILLSGLLIAIFALKDAGFKLGVIRFGSGSRHVGNGGINSGRKTIVIIHVYTASPPHLKNAFQFFWRPLENERRRHSRSTCFLA